MSEVSGIDTSAYQHPSGAPIDWAAVAASGVRVAVLKFGERQVQDPWFTRDYAGAKAAGLKVTAYFFGHPADDAAADAAWFLNRTAGYQFDIPPVLDLEVTDGLPEDRVRAYGHGWCDQVAAGTPTHGDELYTYRSFLADLGTSFGRQVWVAWPGATSIPAGDMGVQNAQGAVPGVPDTVDKDLFNLTPEEAVAKFGLTAIQFVPSALTNLAESDHDGRLPFYGIKPDGSVFAFNGARPIAGLNARGIVRDDVAGFAVLPDDSAIVLACDDGAPDPADTDGWGASTYLLK